MIGDDARRRARIMMPLAITGILTLVLLALPTAGCGSRPRPERPELQTLSAAELRSKLGQLGEPLTLVHVWATWCAPCREEFSVLMRFREKYAGLGVTMILISADAPAQKEAVARYLSGQGAGFPSYIIDNPNDKFINTLCANWSGAMPASFFFGPGGDLRQWWEGKADYDRYRETAEALLKKVNRKEIGQ